MKNCILCSAELKFMNKPGFGSGKLKDGEEICTKCFLQIGKIAGVAVNLKKYSLAEIQQLLQQNTTETSRKGLKLEEIKATIQSLKLDNISSFFGRKEINELPKILAANEQIDHIVQGTYNKGQGILVSTDRRLIFIDKGLIYGLKVEDFPLDKITTIQYETGLMFAEVKIHTSGNIAVIDMIEKAAARKFAEFVRDKLSRAKEQTVPHNNQPASSPNVLDQIAQLGQLKQAGVLSDEEFSEQKKKLLEKL